LGFRLDAESAVAGGRADGTLDMPTGHSYVIEVKYSKDETADLDALAATALAQIKQRRYADRYRGTGKTAHWVGVAVSGRGRVKVATAG
ncbi:MAG: PD-(D/E)XK nuclease domain-containing protein, partial [Propionibacteriaceae bacterium]|nr:PD-(D/E)XK nuclease domain-containing protein [Propionibacteriaceae bacterium]